MNPYKIEKPTSDTGAFVLFLKYTTLFIISWIVGWMVVAYLNIRIPALGNMTWNNAGAISLLIAIAVVAYFIRDILNKYQQGIPFEFSFDDEGQSLKIKLVNTMNDTVREVAIRYANLQMKTQTRSNALTGPQRIIEFYNDEHLITTLNIDLTAWCRHEQLDELISRFKKFSS